MHKEVSMIYLDYMATTPVDPRVVAKMLDYLGPEGHFGNASSKTHLYGQNAALAIDRARQQIAATIHASPQEIIFTSGATESNNLALLGAARFYQAKGKHLITMTTEHKSVLDSMRQLEKEGFEVSYLAPESNGLLRLERLQEEIRLSTILVSIMQVNNETGVIQDLVQIGQCLKNKGIIFHVDAAQSIGKLPLNLAQLPVDLMSLSAHKTYGPKGVGALYIRHKPRIRIQPINYGGGQEHGLRSGTLAQHQIVGMAEAFMIAENERQDEQARLLTYRNRLWQGICDLPGIHLNGDLNARIAGNLNCSFEGLDGNELLLALSELAISNTSACASASTQPSYVLRALGLSDHLAQSAIRLSLGRYTKEEEITTIIAIICKQVLALQARGQSS
jgi:cysteine desulfurase